MVLPGQASKKWSNYQYHTLRITSSCFVTGQAHSEQVFHTFLQATHQALLQLPSMQACDQLLNLLQAKHHLNPEWNLVNQMITLSYHSPQLLLPMQETTDYVQDPKLSLNIASYAKGTHFA